jgi:hypothetical protein
MEDASSAHRIASVQNEYHRFTDMQTMSNYP